MLKRIIAVFVLAAVLFLSGCDCKATDSSASAGQINQQNNSSEVSSSKVGKEQSAQTASKQESQISSNQEDSSDNTVTSSSESSSKTPTISSLGGNVSSDSVTSSEHIGPAVSVSDLTPVSKSQYYCYNKLTIAQKKAYDIIYDMVKNYSTGNKIISGATPTDISIAYNAVHTDNPQFFWMGVIYGLITETTGNVVKYGISFNNDSYLTSSRSDRDSKQKKLEQAVKTVISSVIKQGMSKEEMAKALHDYICTVTSYNYSYTDGERDKYNWTSYGCLIENTSVCEGYSRAYQLLLYNVGINSTLIFGTGNGGAHMWNAVDIGGWKTTDVTWDDYKSGGYGYTYYNKATLNPSSKHRAYKLLSMANETEIMSGVYTLFDELK